MNMQEPQYLGDSVYVDQNYGAILLTTQNGAGPTNEIVLEPEVFRALLKYAVAVGYPVADWIGGMGSSVHQVGSSSGEGVSLHPDGPADTRPIGVVLENHGLTLWDPVRIAPNLKPGVQVGDSWITIERHHVSPDHENRDVYCWTVLRPGLPDVTGHDLKSGVGGGPLREGLENLLGFLDAFAESHRPGEGPGDNHDLFPIELGEWAYLNQDEIVGRLCEIENNPDCIQEDET